jgi:hypothetical protein
MEKGFEYRLIPVDRGRRLMLWWEVGNPFQRDMIVLQMMGPRDGIRAAEGLTPKAARKLARLLLRAANDLEGRPVPHLVKKTA